jgi:catechol 2,3-dioxygenase-like lactoylglutathione lyase family enzyme
MQIASAIAQLRTTNLRESIRFYTMGVGLKLEFQYQDFHAGIQAGHQLFHLKLVDEKTPSIDFVDRGQHFHLYLETDDAHATAEAFGKKGIHLTKEVHDTLWGTREFSIKDDQGHILYFGERRQAANNALSRPPIAATEQGR